MGGGRRALLTLVAMMLVWWMTEPADLGVVEGRSMEPSLRDGQFFLIDHVSYRFLPVARGDVITFRHGTEMYIKRVVAVAGDTLWLLDNPFSGDSELVSSSDLPRVRLLVDLQPRLGRLRRYLVPRGKIFVAGDHRSISYDSRAFGPVPLSVVTGRAWW